MAKIKEKSLDLSTEQKIKKAALKLFTQKGFAATRTRDISDEAGINLALLNYYFRSKEKLFELVMAEILQKFFSGIVEIFNDEGTSLDEKMNIFVSRYTALLKERPELPVFIFHELRMHPQKLASRVGLSNVFKSFFFKQLSIEMDRKKIAHIHPLHYVLNMLGMCVFPFIAAPLLKQVAGLDAKTFEAIVDERKVLVPKWMKSILNTK
jgi:AcrR family transcriptional regulator